MIRSPQGPVTRSLQRWGSHPVGPLLLFVLAVVEATVFPAPTEAMLVALNVAAPGRAVRWTAVAALGSVIGGVAGYWAGATLNAAWAGQALAWSGASQWVETAATLYRDNHALALATSGFTPIPYMVYTSAAGASGIPLLSFVFFSLIGRMLKYSLVGGLAVLAGPAIVRAADRLGVRGAVAAAVALVAAYWLLAR